MIGLGSGHGRGWPFSRCGAPSMDARRAGCGPAPRRRVWADQRTSARQVGGNVTSAYSVVKEYMSSLLPRAWAWVLTASGAAFLANLTVRQPVSRTGDPRPNGALPVPIGEAAPASARAESGTVSSSYSAVCRYARKKPCREDDPDGGDGVLTGVAGAGCCGLSRPDRMGPDHRGHRHDRGTATES